MTEDVLGACEFGPRQRPNVCGFKSENYQYKEPLIECYVYTNRPVLVCDLHPLTDSFNLVMLIHFAFFYPLLMKSLKTLRILTALMHRFLSILNLEPDAPSKSALLWFPKFLSFSSLPHFLSEVQQ